MGENGGKRGKMGGNGESWEIAKNTLWGVQKKCVQLIGNRRKFGEKRDNLAQISHYSESHFPHLSTTSPPFPQVPLMSFARRNWPTGKMGISGLADISRFFWSSPMVEKQLARTEAWWTFIQGVSAQAGLGEERPGSAAPSVVSSQ